MCNGFSRETLFKIDIASDGLNLSKHEWIKEADVVALNWINQGFLSLKEIKKISELGKLIIWTMHDMWNFTGVCHHSKTCDKFTEKCEKCDLTFHARKTFEKKKYLYEHTSIQFVAVSTWLEKKARESALLRDMPVTVIPNAFPVNEFDYRKIGNKKTVIFGAARLDDPIKGFEIAIDAFNILFERNINVKVILFGDIRQSSLLRKIKLPVEYVGQISPNRLPNLYRKADVVLSTSHYETLPGTLIEGMAAGCTPVSFGEGGHRDIFDDRKTGFIAEYLSAESVADKIEEALNAEFDRYSQHKEVVKRFDSSVIAKKYIDLINGCLKRHKY